MLQRLAIFASGNGSNCEQIIRYFHNHPYIKVEFVFTNNPIAGVIERARALQIDCYVMSFSNDYDHTSVFNLLKTKSIDWIILAGFLKKIPVTILKHYPNRIINLHPALLPKFGGKGMYGMNVHSAVLTAGESVTGITIHFVDEEYDRGEIIAQFSVPVLPDDTPETLALRVQKLEHTHYPRVIEEVIMKTVQSSNV